MIAIHHAPGSFSDRWLAYARELGCDVRVVDAYRPDIFEQLRGCKALLWHWEHWRPDAVAAARRILPAAEHRGLLVFPDMKTCWHYDDKAAQKYLLEAVGAPAMPAVVFYDENAAMQWATKAEFPKVFKLACGAGGRNVRLVRSPRQARALIRRAFGRGFKPFGGVFSDGRTRLRALGKVSGVGPKVRKIRDYVRKVHRVNSGLPRQRGYVYFQDYVPQPGCDVRVIIIGDRALACLRETRPGDFRASGSGRIFYEPQRIPLDYVRTAFEVADRLATQCIGFDFLVGPVGEPVIGEISYCFPSAGIYACQGYWDRQLRHTPGHHHPEDLIFDDVLAELSKRAGQEPDTGCASS